MTAQCINLRERFGDLYKVAHDPAYDAERPEFRAQEEPWLQLVLCQHSEIGPHGGEYLLACTKNCGSVATRLAELDCVKVVQDGDDGINVKFHINYFEVVAEILRPRRRRRLSETQRKAAIQRLTKYQFSAAPHDANGVHSQPAGAQ